MKAAALIVFLLGLACVLNSASCIKLDTCGASAGSGGASGSAGAGGFAGSDCSTSASAGSAGGPTSCALLTALDACLSAFCQADGVGTPFCSCYGKGYDLSPAPDCVCVAFDSPGAFSPAAYCAQAAAVDASPSDIDCSATTSPLRSMCVAVQ